jgi:transcription elongation factor Elf1
MGELRGGQSQDISQNRTFTCEFCDIEHSTTDIAYNELGYPVCPACEYEHGP